MQDAKGETVGGQLFPPMGERWAAVLRGEHALRFAAERELFSLKGKDEAFRLRFH